MTDGIVPAESARRVGDDYVLPTGPDDKSRLDLIHAVYGPISLQALDAARIGDATRVADIGCGTGTIARWMAQQIGPGGGVVSAVDVRRRTGRRVRRWCRQPRPR
jgi:SAM-dependent methyltransferase